MNKSKSNRFELIELDEKWKRHFRIVRLFEQGVEIEEIAKIEGLTEEEVDEMFPRLY